MDRNHIDTLARSLLAGPTRRGIVRVMIGSVITGLIELLGMAGIRAGKRKKNKRKRRKKRNVPSPLPPTGPTCVGNCVGKACGDDGCGVSCGACTGSASCENGQCQCPAANQCGTDCCDGPPSCFEDHCTCLGSTANYCSCPADAKLCGNGVGCCLAQDTCIAPVDCFDSGPVCACATQTCGAGNDVCEYEFAFCGSGPPGTCGCFTHASGSPLCAVMPLPDESHCPEFNECAEDRDCDGEDVCANVGCCNPGVLPFVGRCVTPCPTP